MLDLSTIDKDVLLARGEYATVRAAHEDAKKTLSVLCGQLQSVASQVIRIMQPDVEEVPESVDELLKKGRNAIDCLEVQCKLIESLVKQRAELKKEAWSK